MDNNETGKCKKAKLRIGHATKQVEHLTKQMKGARKTLAIIVKKHHEKSENHYKELEIALLTDCPRIVFTHENLPIKFYIDFRLVVEEDELHGAIIYGALRTPRYPYIYKVQPKASEHEEEGPLEQFLVDDQGRIRGSGKMDDEWWLPKEKDGNAMEKDRKATVSEMHHIAIDLIWRRALTWSNEGLLA